jgi:hypothetical protein
MHLTSPTVLDGGVLQHELTLDDIPGLLWTPATIDPSTPVPLLLLGHPGGLGPMLPRLRTRAQQAVALGFAAATLELAGGWPSEDVIDRLVLPLVERAVPEWRALVDDVVALPGVGGPVGVSGGVTALAVRLALTEPRVVAAGLFAGSFVPRAVLEEARDVTVPLHVLLQWDDEGNDRQRALDLFDAFGSREKTLQANLGGHAGIPPYAADDAGRFFARHLRPTHDRAGR